TIFNSLISGNFAGGTGGGINALNSYTSSLTIKNTTITANSASRGGAIDYGIIKLESSIISGNTATTGPDIYTSASGTGSTINSKTSLIGKFTHGVLNDLGGSKTGTLANPIDAKLSPLAYHGGPMPTNALLPGSPAIDAGSNLDNLVTDQRGSGFPRVF